MRTSILLLFTMVLSISIFAQKPVVKDGEIVLNGKSIAKIEKEGCKAFSPNCEFYISSIDSQPLINVIADVIDDPYSNHKRGEMPAKIPYLRFSFTGFDKVCEMRNPSLLLTKEKDIAKIVHRLIKDGALDEVAVENFIKVNGTPITDMLERSSSKPEININIRR